MSFIASFPDKLVAEILDYTVTMPVDDGDNVVSHDVSVTGQAVASSVSRDGAVVSFFLSGGTELEQQRITITIVTALGRTIQRICTLKTH